MNLSKSGYCDFWQCPKILWLKKNRPELLAADSSSSSAMETGIRVGRLARGLFGSCTDVTTYEGDALDIRSMLSKTSREILRGTPVICEASFDYGGLYCAVDILKKEAGGWAIYEVKSSAHYDNLAYIADVAYQKYVLEHCRIKVSGTYIVCLNNEYIFDGTLNLAELFQITDVSELVAKEEQHLPDNLKSAEALLSSEREPGTDLSESCNSPYPCVFWDYCTRSLPKPSVFDLYRMPFKSKLALYYSHITSYRELADSGLIRNAKQLRQLQYGLEDKGTYVNANEIRHFLGALSYPLYFLDFETMQPAVSEFIGTKPYQQVPFQYSLHYIEKENGILQHKEFLAESGTDPRRSLAEKLCADIPMDVCVTAYNKSFECSRIQELANIFPDLAEHLLNIKEHIVDLLVPFQSGYYYNRSMGGSFSIKSVLPAIFPDDPELDYHNLEDVHNGSEAMEIFPKIQYMAPDEQLRARANLLKYCCLDTYAMVKVWEELVHVSKSAADP